MKKQFLRFILYAIIIYLTGTLNPTVVASQPSWGNGTHFCGITERHRITGATFDPFAKKLRF